LISDPAENRRLIEKVLKTKDPYSIEIEKDEFIKRIIEEGICRNANRVKSLSK